MCSIIQITRVCKHCGNEYTARTTVTRYCSDGCSKRAYRVKQRAAKIESSNSETQRIRSKPVDDLKAKEFLSITETCTLLGISRRTIYRMFNRREVKAGKAGKRTNVKRASIDKLFDVSKPESNELKQPVEFVESECYNVADVRKKYSISQTALRNLILKHNIPTFYKGWFAYVPKAEINGLLSTPRTT